MCSAGCLWIFEHSVLVNNFFLFGAYCGRRRGNGFKLKVDEFKLLIRNKFITLRDQHWNRSPGEIVDPEKC